MTDSPTTHFGYQTVDTQAKAGMVRGVFDRVASRYDVMNDAMSLGLHRLWKDEMVRVLAPQNGMNILDMAGGTGDIAFRILKRAPDAHVTLADINASMLAEGKMRAVDRNILGGIDWVCADAETLPMPDRSFDAYTIAFGIRNVTHIEKALSEAYRVMKPGGRFLCLEFSEVRNPMLARAYDAYSFSAIPMLGKMIAGDDAPYRYLVESIRKFPDQKTFATMIGAAGFARASWRNFAGGAVALHTAWRV